MPKPVCIDCGLFFKPLKTGVTVEEGRPMSNDREGPWGPYRLWRADLYECRGCGKQIVIGFAGGPWKEHYMPDYNETKERSPPIVFVADC